jgi:hypothetical protein
MVFFTGLTSGGSRALAVQLIVKLTPFCLHPSGLAISY